MSMFDYDEWIEHRDGTLFNVIMTPRDGTVTNSTGRSAYLLKTDEPSLPTFSTLEAIEVEGGEFRATVAPSEYAQGINDCSPPSVTPGQ